MSSEQFSRFEHPDVAEKCLNNLRLMNVGAGAGLRMMKLVSVFINWILIIEPDKIGMSDWRSGYPIEFSGEPKGIVAARILTQMNPDLTVKIDQFYVNKTNRQRFKQASERCNLALVNIDDPEGIEVISEELHQEMPIVSVHMTHGGRIGQVVFTLPGKTPCLRCSLGPIEQLRGGRADPIRFDLTCAVAMKVIWELVRLAYGSRDDTEDIHIVRKGDAALRNVLLVSCGERDLVFGSLPPDHVMAVQSVLVQKSCSICRS